MEEEQVRWLRCFGWALAAVLVTTPAVAQQLVYTPISPFFGGNPFNSTQLLGVAAAQNGYKDPNAPPTAQNSQAEMFANQLQSMLLSALAGQVTNAIFGQNPQQNGTIVFGTQTITFNRTLSNVELKIFDSSTGQTTNVSVPLLQTSAGG